MSFFVTKPARAEKINYRISAIDGEIRSLNVDLTHVQPRMICQFSLSGKSQESAVYPQSRFIKLSNGHYQIKIQAATLFEWLPSLQIKNCHFKLMLIGKSLQEERPYFREILLHGVDDRQMTDEELRSLFDRGEVSRLIREKIQPLDLDQL